MRNLTRRIFVILFSLLFEALLGNLMAHAEQEIFVQAVNPHFPVNEVYKLDGFVPYSRKKTAWYVRHADKRGQIFEAAGLTEKVKSWKEMRKDQFLITVEAEGVKTAKARFPQLSQSQIAKAEIEIRKVIGTE